MNQWIYLRHLLSAFLLMFVYSLITSAINLMVLPIISYFNFSRGAFTLGTTLLMIPNLLLSPFLGNFVNRLGLRRMLLVGSVWGAAALALLACCRTLLQFYLVFFLGGFVFSSTSSYLASLLLNSWFKKHQALVCSIVMTGTGVGGMLWGVLVPPLVQRFSYQAGYAFCSILWLTLMLLCAFLCKGLPQDMGVLPYGGQASPTEQPAATGSVPTRSTPLRQPMFYLLCYTFFSLSLVNGFFPHTQAYLVDHGYALVDAGRVISLFCMALVFVKLLLGAHFEHKGLRSGILLPVAIDFLALLLLYFGQKPLLTLAVVLFSANSSLVALTPLLIAGQLYNAREFAVVWGLFSAASGIGNSVGSPLWGLLYDVSGSYQPGFLIAMVLLTLWLVLSQHLLAKAGQTQ
ncbi:MFS transporter [uncultured Gemmiger sp.]|uniref:MFS transporter n=1 Tax=uncultured Gemmiger sp. TaxID=1623490 RepID=UPI0025EC4262|nr:MFS transporter [uncultured Gemmiger sp.]